MVIHFLKIFQTRICGGSISAETQQVFVSHVEGFIEKLRANTLVKRHFTRIHCGKKKTLNVNFTFFYVRYVVLTSNPLKKQSYFY